MGSPAQQMIFRKGGKIYELVLLKDKRRLHNATLIFYALRR
jgi:hypothetical protein